MPQSTVLIVDDDPVARHIAHTALKAAGFNTAVAVDALNALMQTQKSKPDLVLLDLGLPAGGGFVYLQRKATMPAIALIPVLVISGQDRASSEQRAIEGGASAYMEKPVTGDAIVSKVRELLGNAS